ncbi:MAG: hypothetical protein ACI9T7_000003 [Oleiphilaceae bacterium]|jgi:hypothetical protein
MEIVIGILKCGSIFGSFWVLMHFWGWLMNIIGVRFNYLDDPIYSSKTQKLVANLIFLVLFGGWTAVLILFL